MVRSEVSPAIAVFGGVVTLVFAGVATASTASRDAASTRAFIVGELGVDRATLTHGPAELAAGKAYSAHVSGECAGAPLPVAQKLSALVLLLFVTEVVVGYDDVTLTSVRPAINRIARGDERLRFSDPAGARFSKDALTLIAGQSTPGALIRMMRSYAPAAVASGLQRLKTLNHRVAQLPVARVEYELLRELFGKPATSVSSSARVRSLLGYVGRARL